MDYLVKKMKNMTDQLVSFKTLIRVYNMKEFRKLIQQQFNKMCKTGKLFRSSITGAQLWEIYLKNTEKSVFRDPNSTSFNCNNCNNFIRRYGNVVSIDENYNIISMFDIDIDGEYSIAAKELSKALKSSTISIDHIFTYPKFKVNDT